MSEPVTIPADTNQRRVQGNGRPVPSTVIERYFSRNSHDGGMSFEVTFELDSPADKLSCAQSWREARVRHPRTHSILTGSGKRQSWQRIPVDEAEAMQCVADPSLADLEPCVRSGRGAVLILCNDSDNPFLRLKFHHAACDAVGAGRMIGDFFSVLHGYDRPSRPSTGTLPGTARNEFTSAPRDSKEAADRPSSNTTRPSLRNVLHTIRGKNLRIDSHIGDEGEPETTASFPGEELRVVGPNTIAFETGQETSRRLRQNLRERKIPLNDFAVAVVSLALADFSRDFASPKMHVMVMNPVQMRNWANRRSSANHLGFAFIRRRHDHLEWSDCSDIDETLESIHRELTDVRTLGIAGELVWGIGLMENVPGSLSAIERMGWFTPTASVTCLSSIKFARRYGFADGMAIGNAAVKRVNMVAPVQAGGQLAVTIWNLGDRISWSLRIRSTAGSLADPTGERDLMVRRLAARIGHLTQMYTIQKT